MRAGSWWTLKGLLSAIFAFSMFREFSKTLETSAAVAATLGLVFILGSAWFLIALIIRELRNWRRRKAGAGKDPVTNGNLAECPACGAVNRIENYSIEKRPRCAGCHALLPESFHVRVARALGDAWSRFALLAAFIAGFVAGALALHLYSNLVTYDDCILSHIKPGMSVAATRLVHESCVRKYRARK
ncbi:MAG: hypothetical protein HY749_01845 [Gammaproteobacteria bacterium]|nr:hypothetical protein [Gammaproteobacteria bacterium]MBI5618660.1 hypothetical protein [Gammaproteobacteria bacterium]